MGLGNPGKAYENTRHNLGAAMVDRIAAQERIALSEDKKARAIVAEIRSAPGKIFLIKPQTYMNESGSAVKEFARYHAIVPAHIVVVYDDVDLEIGQIRLRPKGSAGGHKGVESITAHLGTPDFPRIRIGIGKNYDPRAADEYVLKKIPPSEREALDFAVALAADAAMAIVRDGIEAAMNRFNAPPIKL